MRRRLEEQRPRGRATDEALSTASASVRAGITRPLDRPFIRVLLSPGCTLRARVCDVRIYIVDCGYISIVAHTSGYHHKILARGSASQPDLRTLFVHVIVIRIRVTARARFHTNSQIDKESHSVTADTSWSRRSLVAVPSSPCSSPRRASTAASCIQIHNPMDITCAREHIRSASRSQSTATGWAPRRLSATVAAGFSGAPSTREHIRRPPRCDDGQPRWPLRYP